MHGARGQHAAPSAAPPARRVLVAFCLIAMLLEASMNAGVTATFQPIAVTQFGWGADQIAFVNNG